MAANCSKEDASEREQYEGPTGGAIWLIEERERRRASVIQLFLCCGEQAIFFNFRGWRTAAAYEAFGPNNGVVGKMCICEPGERMHTQAHRKRSHNPKNATKIPKRTGPCMTTVRCLAGRLDRPPCLPLHCLSSRQSRTFHPCSWAWVGWLWLKLKCKCGFCRCDFVWLHTHAYFQRVDALVCPKFSYDQMRASERGRHVG